MITLVRYGYPQGDAKQWIEACRTALARLDDQDEDDHVGRAGAIGDAMIDLLAVWLLSEAEVQEPPFGFWAHVHEVLDARRPAVAAWLGLIDTALWQRNRDGWYEACMGRSAAEVLASSKAPDQSEEPLVPAHRLAEVDAEMREIGPQLNKLPTDAIPRNMPTAHWWWFLPQGPRQDDTDEFDFAI